jgi:tRNA (cytidine/uridine-2'-O-)-methyltransferase
VLLFGKESAGVPAAVHEACDARVRIPMRPQVRSMNLATSAGIALGEALRQTGRLPDWRQPARLRTQADVR